MRKYIDAEQMKYQIRHQGVPDDYYNDEDSEDIMCEMVDDLPDADVAEVIHSEWHTATVRMSCIDVTCRNCHRTEKISITNYFEYCPHCGAKMDGERKDENDD